MPTRDTQTTRTRLSLNRPRRPCGAGCAPLAGLFMEQLSNMILARRTKCAMSTSIIYVFYYVYRSRIHREFPMGPPIQTEISGPNLTRRHFLPSSAQVRGGFGGECLTTRSAPPPPNYFPPRPTAPLPGRCLGIQARRKIVEFTPPFDVGRSSRSPFIHMPGSPQS